MFLSLLEKRRSIRSYRDRPLGPDQVDRLVEAALRAPSSRNLRPWEFVLVTDRDLLGRLARTKPHGSSFLSEAALGIVVAGFPQRCDVWVEDCSIAAVFIHLAAADMGLGSCWIQIRKRMHDESTSAESYVRSLLGMPDDLRVEAIVAVGVPDQTLPPHGIETLSFSRVHRNRFGAAETRADGSSAT